MTREEQLQKRAEVLRQGHTDLLASPPNCACTSFAADAIAEDDRIAAEPVEEADPAPAWRPIAEMPPEWRDGRLVRLGCSKDGNEYLCSWAGPDEPLAPGWYIWDGEDWTPLRVIPTHYLTLTIPEVPRG